MTWAAICEFRLVTADLERLSRYYTALGFAAGEPGMIDADEMHLLGLAGTGRRLTMTLGDSRLALDQFAHPGRPYPPEATAADLIFQHLALVTSDIDAAWAQAVAAGAQPISRDGPVTLPPSAGRMTALKFRDPEGHPLELLCFPEDRNSGWSGHGVLGIDHSAICVANAELSRRFYERQGLSRGDGSFNQGPTQVALDGLDDVRVDVVPINPRATPPHLELLAYRNPAPRPIISHASNDIAATRVVWHADRDALIRDPDGHLHQLNR